MADKMIDDRWEEKKGAQWSPADVFGLDEQIRSSSKSLKDDANDLKFLFKIWIFPKSEPLLSPGAPPQPCCDHMSRIQSAQPKLNITPLFQLFCF